jgi:hypothetical protein
MLEFIFFLAGLAIGHTLQKSPKSVIQDTKLREELAVANNLNDSLKKDLQEAKELVWQLKNKVK